MIDDIIGSVADRLVNHIGDDLKEKKELKRKFTTYYKKIYDGFTTENQNYSDIVGNLPLSEAYIEPFCTYYEAMDAHLTQVSSDSFESYMHKWAFDTDNPSSVLLIHGEPGHGKSSLCQKAIYDFFNTMGLIGTPTKCSGFR